jgi:chitin disaccharide deacetylase
MIRTFFIFRTLSFLLPLISTSFLLAQDKPAPADRIRLIVRADDMGAAQGINEACIRAYREGIAKSVEVIVPGPWFLQAVQMLKDNPGLDVGVHLCLTSEWESVKWRPLTAAPSLVDENGYFYPMTSQRKDFPPNTGFLQSPPKPDDVEKELRAQIETARKHIPRISHLSAHMGAAVASPELRQITQKLAAEYGIPLEAPGLQSAGGFGGTNLTPEQKEARMIALLGNLKPGLYVFVEHPGIDSPEMRAIGHKGYENVAADRAGVTAVFTSPRVKQIIRDRGIELVSYADVIRDARK